MFQHLWPVSEDLNLSNLPRAPPPGTLVLFPGSRPEEGDQVWAEREPKEKVGLRLGQGQGKQHLLLIQGRVGQEVQMDSEMWVRVMSELMEGLIR